MSARLHSQKIMAFVGVRDPERAKTFYRDTLGLQLVTEQLPFALVFDVQGIMLRVSIVPEVVAAPYTVVGWAVPADAEAGKELTSAGAEVVRFNGMRQDKMGGRESPG